MERVTFGYQHLKPSCPVGQEEYYTVDWTGYTGGEIPAGLIVARLSGLADHKKPVNLWTVFHKSGFVVNYDLALPTRKQAVAFAVELGKIAGQAGFSWDQGMLEIQKQTASDGTYHSIKAHLIPNAIRKVMAK